jgi:hypothetical protein
MRPRSGLVLLILSALALPVLLAPAAPARPCAPVEAPTLARVPLALSPLSLGGAAAQAGGAIATAPRGAATEALEALARHEQQLAASDPAANQNFGWSVAVSGDTAVVGAWGDQSDESPLQGTAYVFTRSGATWTQQQVLTASDGASADRFGSSVAISDDTLLIGACNFNMPGPGAAYVFTRTGALWTQQQKLTASDGTNNSVFGYGVALDGDTAVVGAQWQPYDAAADTGGPGAVYVFTRSGTIWSEQQKLTAGDATAEDRFGYSLALEGDTLLVSAPGRTVGANALQGVVFVYARSGGAWSRQQVLVQSDGGARNFFGGQSIALQGNTALLGAGGHNERRGAAYVFTRGASGWSQTQELTASNSAPEDLFGDTCALDGDKALFGAWLRQVGENVDQGAAFVFTRTGAGWVQDGEALLASDGAAGDWFGVAVGLSGGSAFIGAPLKTIAGLYFAGAAYVFGLPSTITPAADGFGAVSPDGAQTVDYGATPTFRFAPEPGYEVAAVTVDGAAVTMTAANAYTFPAVVADHALAVSFVALPDNRPNCSANRPVGWQKRPVKLAFIGYPGPYGIAVAFTQYRLGDGAWTDGGGVTVRRQGVTRVQYRAVDVDGNVGATNSCVVRLDSRRPLVEARAASGPAGAAARLSYRVADHVPGCGRALVRLVVLDAAGHALTRASTLPAPVNTWRTVRISTRSLTPGAYTVVLRAVDAAGNFQSGVTHATLTVN